MIGARLARDKVAAVAAVAFAVAVATFARSMAYGFVYDDHWTVEGRQFDMPATRLFWALARGQAHGLEIPDETRPAMVASIWIDRTLFGLRPAGFHAHSVLLYGVVSALAAWAAFAVSRRRLVALVAGVFFALAPVHAEVACAINYREDLIAAAGILVPLAVLLRPRRVQQSWTSRNVDSAKNPPWLEGFAAVCWVAGLLGKESTIALVPLVALFAIAPASRARLRERTRLLGVLGVALGAWCVWRGALLFAGDDIPRAPHLPLLARLAATARFCVRTALVSLMPIQTSPEYARQPPASPLWLVALAVCAGACVLLWRSRRTRLAAMGLAIALVAPLPASPLAGPSNEFADRYAFVGVFGAGLVWGWLVWRAASRLPAPRSGMEIALGVVALALGLACQAAAAPWRSDLTLWLAATERAPTSPRAWVGLSRAHRLAGDLERADRDIDRAIELDPRFVTARVTRVYNLLARGDVAHAREELGAIHDLGGALHRGVSKAEQCAALPPSEAIRCVH